VLTDIKVRSVGFETYDIHAQHLPDLFAQRPVILFGKWRGTPAGYFELTGKTGRGEYVTRFDVGGIQPDESNRALGYLWARSRIAELSDFGSRELDEAKVQEITALGLKYSLLTRYTSFIAVREVVRNPSGDAKDVNQALPLPLGVSDLAVGDGTAVGSEPELVLLVTLFLTIAGFAILRKRFLPRFTAFGG
jgi:Ca-activated chloride channel family protein